MSNEEYNFDILKIKKKQIAEFCEDKLKNILARTRNNLYYSFAL